MVVAVISHSMCFFDALNRFFRGVEAMTSPGRLSDLHACPVTKGPQHRSVEHALRGAAPPAGGVTCAAGKQASRSLMPGGAPKINKVSSEQGDLVREVEFGGGSLSRAISEYHACFYLPGSKFCVHTCDEGRKKERKNKEGVSERVKE